MESTPARRTGIVAAATAFCVVFAAGATPIPLYSTYRTENGVTTDQLALAAVTYFAGAILTLLVLARLSDHLGRKPIALTALGVAALGCIVFILVTSAPLLLIGRGLQGVAAGLASSALAAYVVDTGARATTIRPPESPVTFLLSTRPSRSPMSRKTKGQ